MFSFIRDRYVALEFPITIPDCQLCCGTEDLEGTRRASLNSKTPIITHENDGPSNKPKTINKQLTYDYDNEYEHPLEEYLKNTPVAPEKIEYRRLKEIDQAKYVFVFDAEASKKAEHRRFNRYINIFPYDFNRIKLKSTIMGSDYLNGSYITGPLSEENPTQNRKLLINENLKSFELIKFRNITFLATMGPNLATIAHHWTAIYESNVDIIVMLTKLRERSSGSNPSTEKCAQYWPSTKETPLRAGCFEITMLDEQDFTPEIKKRIFSVKNVGSTNASSEEKRITQLQYTGWPDYGVPEKADHLTNLVKKVRYIIQSNQNKISMGEKFTVLAHCSAGVGRTGTFIAMYQMMDQIEDIFSINSPTSENDIDKTQYIDIFKAELFLRSKRVEMVQSWAQYQYLYNSVADYAKQIKAINDGSDDYVDYNN